MEKTRYEQFDGLRLWMSLIIIASHTNALCMKGQGGLMVVYFFVLSGFFMTCPMLKDGEEKFAALKGWLHFYLLRAVRIFPVYAGGILLVYWLSDDIFADETVLIQNLLFLNCQGPLWYIQQQMLCYLLVPIIISFIYLIKKYFKVTNLAVCILLLLFGTGLWYYLTDISDFCLLGNGGYQPFRFGLFLIGMAFGYLAKADLFYPPEARRYNIVWTG